MESVGKLKSVNATIERWNSDSAGLDGMLEEEKPARDRMRLGYAGSSSGKVRRKLVNQYKIKLD
ncbi:hypothetical protein U1Q18_030831 [Sarracenia purpurea var. burkii]